MYTATFQSGLLTILKNANEFKIVCLLLLILSIHISGPTTVQNQIF